MRRIVAVLVLTTACMTASPGAQKVRVTSNPDVVKGCRFLGNVRATTGFGGSAGTSIGENNVSVAMREKTLGLGGDTLYLNQTGLHGEGEAYRCVGEPHEVIK